MAVGRHEDVALRVHEDLPVRVHAGPHALREEEDVVGVEPEVVVLLEALDRRLVVRLGSHHVEGNRRLVADFARDYLAGVEVEEGRPRDRPDGIASLRPVVAEARTLAAGDEKRGDAAGPELLLARGLRLLQLRAFENRDLRGLAALRVGSGLPFRKSLLAVREIVLVDA